MFPNIPAGVFASGGYFTDLFGRKRILVRGILLYGVSACAAGFSTSLSQLTVLSLRNADCSICGLVVATTWLPELFANPKRRESVLAHTQAFYTSGRHGRRRYCLAVTYGGALPMVRGGHEASRFTLLSRDRP